jgi:hypothetical protein
MEKEAWIAEYTLGDLPKSTTFSQNLLKKIITSNEKHPTFQS